MLGERRVGGQVRLALGGEVRRVPLRREVRGGRLVAVEVRHEAELGVAVALGLGQLLRGRVELGQRLRRLGDPGRLERVLVVVQAVRVVQQRQRAALCPGTACSPAAASGTSCPGRSPDLSRNGFRSANTFDEQNVPTLSVVNDETTSGEFGPPARSACLILSSAMLPTDLDRDVRELRLERLHVGVDRGHLARRAPAVPEGDRGTSLVASSLALRGGRRTGAGGSRAARSPRRRSRLCELEASAVS